MDKGTDHLAAVERALAPVSAGRRLPHRTIEEFRDTERQLTEGIERIVDNVSTTVLAAIDKLQSELDELRTIVAASAEGAKANMKNHIAVAASALESCEIIHREAATFRTMLGLEGAIRGSDENPSTPQPPRAAGNGEGP